MQKFKYHARKCEFANIAKRCTLAVIVLSVDTPLKKIPGGKSGLSMVRDSKPKLLDQLRERLRARHYSRRVQGTMGAPGQSPEPI